MTTREKAAYYCALFASTPTGRWTTPWSDAGAVRPSEPAAQLALEAVGAAIRAWETSHKRQLKYADMVEIWGEAEAMLRTGWAP